MNEKIDVLKQLEIGARVAEEEADALRGYFVYTDQWEQVISGKIDVIYGPKGSGKSALYTLLNANEGVLFDRGILIAPAENVRGATVFRNIVAAPPPSELSFVYLWKIYFLTIIAKTLRDYGIENDEAKSLIDTLQTAKVLPYTNTLQAIFKTVSDYFKGWINRDLKAVEYAISVDSMTGTPSLSRKTEFKEKTEEQNLGEIPIEELMEVADRAVAKAGLKVWLLLDRLDVAFADSPELERSALRALFRTYNDFKAFSNISLKIFVRDDIWRRITAGGFTEASHITKAITINWTEESLLNLVALRLLNNDSIVDHLKVDKDEVKSKFSNQTEMFYRIVPDKIDTGKNPETFKWMISRTSDATGISVPREIIHLLDVAREIQIKKLERGSGSLSGEMLFERAAFKEALPVVSKVRYEQTLLAEYPDVKPYLEKLNAEKAEQNYESLSSLWNTNTDETSNLCRRLVEIGFFEERGTKDEPTFWVPFLYRGALNLIQGKAEG